ncbi:MOSC domain-containing protein [Guptibacillus hwajinpoensis]|uniref:MOSC domain-containing protein YiiM n=1 Tax=Guptibacillus hwajinpoensis TaxID=208199 RepID=A0ABU0K4U5_9BACL|nr:MOSC domain-containing protein [Alkalihalobacillus hemicentroti]MDQ0484382.1 MOSC domain-containing protein YiiM [Alkalihalobacillus hemicentroti]
MKLLSVNVGKPIETDYKGKNIETGIYKQPVSEKVYVSREQVEGDGQADLVHHGGSEKAICVYPIEHYSYWEEKLQRQLKPGAFGENFTVSGLDEKEALIGDIYKIGETRVQVSLPRQPCFKLAKKFEVDNMHLFVMENGYSGYYLRVLEEGYVKEGDDVTVEYRPTHGVTVALINRLTYHDKKDRVGLEQAMLAKELSESWYNKLRKQLSAL